MLKFSLDRSTPQFFKKASLKTVLTLMFVCLVVISVGFTNYLAFRNGQRAVNEIALRLRSEVTARIEQHLHTYLEIPHLINIVNTNAIVLKQLDIWDVSSLERQFHRQGQLFNSVSYIYFANEASGEFIGVKKESDDLLTITTGFGRDFYIYATDEQGTRGKLLSMTSYIDARVRPWYRAAVQAEQCLWNPIYVWERSRNISIDAVCPSYSGEGRLEGVLGVSLLLSDMNEFLRQLKIGSAGKTFIMERSGVLVSASTSETGITIQGDTAARVNATESTDPFIRLAVQQIEKFFDQTPGRSVSPLDQIDRIQYLDFEIEGERQFVQITPFHDKRGLDWLIVVLIPESEFLAQIQANTRNTIVQCVFALLIAVGLGITTARWVTQPILRLNNAAKALAKGEWNQTVVIDREDEVGQLAKSFTQMTKQLHESFATLEAKNVELSKAETALRASERQYRLLVENVADGIGIIQERSFVFVNDTLPALLGCQRDLLVGKSPAALLPNGEASYLKRLSKHIAQEHSDQQWDVREFALKQVGQEIWIEARYSLITWASQQALLVTMRDITERKRKEQEIEAERQKLRQENIRLRTTMKDRYRFGAIIGKSLVMQEVYELIVKAAATDAHLVIYGESGTGKELIAQTIHTMSKRGKAAFVPVNCGSIPETLFEREFFGHRKGAFTGAIADSPGLFDAAQKGTLFLDEIGELPLPMQVKLLRAIEGGGYTPVGSQTVKYANVRIVAATNRDIVAQVKEGNMRADFFYRINVITIKVPPLRTRKEDIPLLAEHFLTLYGDGNKPRALPGRILEALYNYDWPGNVRQLQNVIQRYLTLKRLEIGDEIYEEERMETSPIQQKIREIGDVNLPQAVEAFEKQCILNMLQRHGWHRNATAVALGITPRTLRRKISRYQLDDIAQES